MISLVARTFSASHMHVGEFPRTRTHLSGHFFLFSFFISYARDFVAAAPQSASTQNDETNAHI